MFSVCKNKFKNFIVFIYKLVKNVMYYQENYLNKHNRDVLFKIAFLGVLGWLIFKNWSIITDAQKITDIKSFLGVIQTPNNLIVFKLGIVYIVATSIYFLVRLPLLKIEQLKVPGLEYKVEVENAVKLVNENIEDERGKEEARLSILDAMTTSHFKESVRGFVTRERVDMIGMVTLLKYIIDAYVLNSLDIKFDSKVIGVINGTPEQTEYNQLNINTQLLVDELIATCDVWKVHDGRRSILAVSCKWNTNSEDFCILCLKADSNEWKFSKVDYLMVSTAWNIMRDTARLSNLTSSDIILTRGQAVDSGGDSV